MNEKISRYLKFQWCWFANKIFFWSPWKRGIVIKAWKEELERGTGGIGDILLVLRKPLPGEIFDNEIFGCHDDSWVMHPKSYKKHLIATGSDVKVRLPLILDQAIHFPEKYGERIR